MNLLEKLRESLGIIEEKILVEFVNKDLLILAFVHRSFVNEYRELLAEHNERLEFLGDSVLGLVMADYLYRKLPDYPEGMLSQLRSRLVDANACIKYLQQLDLGEFILLGKGERMSEGKAKGSILADVFEALVGAIYLDGGFLSVKSFLTMHFERDFEEAICSPSCNYKADLQNYSQRVYQKPPTYRVIAEVGPDHAKIFHVVVSVGEKELGAGCGPSKKEAEQQAALVALDKIL